MNCSKKILSNYRGGPVGLETLASLLGEDKDTIELMYEPFFNAARIFRKKQPKVNKFRQTRYPIQKRNF